MGCSCRWRSQLSFVRNRILLLQEQMVAPFQEVGFWHPTIEKTFWFQASVVYLGTFTPRSWRRTTGAYLLFTDTNIGRHAVHLLHGGIGKVHGGLLIIPKVKTEMHQVLSERSDLLLSVFGMILRQKTFTNSMYFVTDWLFTGDGGVL